MSKRKGPAADETEMPTDWLGRKKNKSKTFAARIDPLSQQGRNDRPENRNKNQTNKK